MSIKCFLFISIQLYDLMKPFVINEYLDMSYHAIKKHLYSLCTLVISFILLFSLIVFLVHLLLSSILGLLCCFMILEFFDN